MVIQNSSGHRHIVVKFQNGRNKDMNLQIYRAGDIVSWKSWRGTSYRVKNHNVLSFSVAELKTKRNWSIAFAIPRDIVISNLEFPINSN